jgi:GxxExxY protein
MRVEILEAERANSIVAGFYDVYNYFDYGLSESVYIGALELELCERGHKVVRELRVPVTYKGRRVAWQRLDMVVDGKIIVESKATEKLAPAARTQIVSYLRASTFAVGLLLHFGPKPSFQRFIDWPKRQRDSKSAVVPP